MTKITFAVAGMGLLLACDETQPERRIAGAPGPSFMTAAWSQWSDPVHLDAPVNSACQDQTPTLSKDELSLYFTSTRRGGFGNDTPDGCQDSFDLWVAKRASRDGPWETAVNLGPLVNTNLSEAGPAVSANGRLLFFYRFVPGGQRDIYAAVREDVQDEQAWGVPANLGPDVNTAVDEEGPTFIDHEGDGDGTLFFDRGSPPAATNLHSVRVTKNGETLGPAVALDVLNSAVEDNHTSVRRDGRELFFDSRRPGAVGGAGFDIWVATRGNVHEAWSTPVNIGEPVNSRFAEFHPNLSVDGRTLLFISPAPRGGLGGFDIWMTTRTQGNN